GRPAEMGKPKDTSSSSSDKDTKPAPDAKPKKASKKPGYRNQRSLIQEKRGGSNEPKIKGSIEGKKGGSK
ncbi:hypothetical protein PMAYCL1PPCAC_26044, partial [Pristionchus mayeri]